LPLGDLSSLEPTEFRIFASDTKYGAEPVSLGVQLSLDAPLSIIQRILLKFSPRYLTEAHFDPDLFNVTLSTIND